LADFDVSIVGAGPAGCATAISIADFAPELSVCLIDGTTADSIAIGETVPPPIEPMLRHLGLFEQFAADGHCATYRTLSAWGSARLASNEFLFQTQQRGWRLDRARFDAMLVRAARARVAQHVAGKLVRIVAARGGWRLFLDTGASHTTRFAVDATGAALVVARMLGRRPIVTDRLVGCSVALEGARDDDPELLVETFPDGWWYTAGLPHAQRIVVCMTDADEVRRLGVRRTSVFEQLLAQTRHVRAAAGGGRILATPRLWPASSRCLKEDPAVPLIAVGDAAARFDPVSGQGIVKALRSGIFASYGLADWLRQKDDRGLRRYWALVEREFDTYRATLRDYYMLERRWADRPFWRRRRGTAAAHDDTSAPLVAAAGP
jgi:2-polyprenyl-6-methoxyphenol hydroxylase-like FAD-dependent oxidoreductase